MPTSLPSLARHRLAVRFLPQTGTNMDVSSLTPAAVRREFADPTHAGHPRNAGQQSAVDEISAGQKHESSSEEPLREAFRDFVGQTLFGSLLASMRKSVGKPAYLHGGRTEEVFQKQLDQHIVKDLTEASADTLADPMYELFNMQRRS